MDLIKRYLAYFKVPFWHFKIHLKGLTHRTIDSTIKKDLFF